MSAPKIPTTEIQSSNLHAIGFDEPTKTLAVHFRNGAIWHYPGASPELWKRFDAAESKGKFFNDYIKGKFTDAQKMTGSCPACRDIGWIGDECLDCGAQRYVVDDRREERAKARA
jgi:hypothetical protein